MTSRPLDILDKNKGKRLMLRLKNGSEITGVLKAFDIHLNLWLEEAEERNDKKNRKLGKVMLRGDNIIFASPE